MKEIFNSIRNKASQCSDKACFIPDDAEVITESRLKQIVDEAEAKWEAEVCEWKPTGLCEPPRYLEAHDLIAYELDASLWKYCPICGKPIKISEVE